MKKDARMSLMDRNLLLLSRMMEALIRIKNGEPKGKVIKEMGIPKHTFQQTVCSSTFSKYIQEEYADPLVKDMRGIPTFNGYENLFLAVTGCTSILDIPSDVEDTVRKVMDKVLNKREIKILKMYYWSNMTLEQIGEVIGVTRGRVGSLHDRAFRKLKMYRDYMLVGDKGYRKLKEMRLADELEVEKARLAELNRIKSDLADVRKQELDVIDEILKVKLNIVADRTSIYEMRIEDMDLSVRSYNCLKRNYINTVGDLHKMNLWSLNHMRNLGRKSIEEITTKYRMVTREEFDMNDQEPPVRS